MNRVTSVAENSRLLKTQNTYQVNKSPLFEC